MMKYAQYRAAKSLDHEQGNQYSSHVCLTYDLLSLKADLEQPIFCKKSRPDQPVCVSIQHLLVMTSLP